MPNFERHRALEGDWLRKLRNMARRLLHKKTATLLLPFVKYLNNLINSYATSYPLKKYRSASCALR